MPRLAQWRALEPDVSGAGMGIKEHRVTYSTLIGLFALAVILRLIYLKVASDALGFERVAHFAQDSNLYLMLADHILSWERGGSYGLLRVGPGYALMLAAIKLVFGPNPIWPILVNIVLGGLAPVAVYLLAWQLLSSRAVALLAGLFSAVSLTSISLSCHILTDQPYFTLQAMALVMFVRGYCTGRLRWYVAAGLTSGFAAHVRPVGQMWPLIFLLFALVLPRRAPHLSRLRFFGRASITGLVMLLMVLGWSVRNYAIHDLFVFGTNGALTVRSCLVAGVAEKTRGEGKTLVDYRNEWEEEDGDRSDSFVAAYAKASARVKSEINAHPWIMLREYFLNMRDNMVAETGYAYREIPQVKYVMAYFILYMRTWLGYVLVGLTLLGLAVMIIRREVAAAWILGGTYVSFSIILGGSLWQGSRLHYPAEMAWAILIAYLLVQIASGIRRLWERLVNRS